MNLIPGRTVESPYPHIEFTVTDSLSGIGDDQSFDIRIDKNWLIPEYDPETGICRVRPVEPLAERGLTMMRSSVIRMTPRRW